MPAGENVFVRVTTTGVAGLKGLASTFTMVKTAAVGLGAYLAYDAARDFAQFERKVADVYTLMDRADPMFGKFEDGLRKVKLAVPLAELDDLTNATYKYISATGDTANALEVTNKVARTAIGNQAESAEVMNVLNKSYANFGFTAKDTDKILEGFSETISEADATGADLAQQFGRMAAASELMGFTFSETLSAFAVGSRALNVEEVATGWTALGQALAINQEKFDKLNISTANLYDMLSDVAALDLTKTELVELFGSARSVKLIKPLLKNLDEVKRVTEEIGDASGVMAGKYETAMDTTAGDAAVVAAAFEDLKLTAGETLADAFGNLYTAVSEATDALDKLDGEAEDTKETLWDLAIASAKWSAGFIWLPGAVAKLDEMWGSLKNVNNIIVDLARGSISWGKAIDEVSASLRAMVHGEAYERPVFGEEMIEATEEDRKRLREFRRKHEGYTRPAWMTKTTEWGREAAGKVKEEAEDTGGAAGKAMAEKFDDTLDRICSARDYGQTAGDEMAERLKGVRAGRQAAFSMLPPESELKQFMGTLKDNMNYATAAGMTAAVMRGDVKGIFANLFSTTLQSGLMSLLGKLPGGGILGFLPFQTGGYTGEYDVLARLHPHEFVIPKEVLTGREAMSTELRTALSETGALGGGSGTTINITDRASRFVDVETAKSAERGNRIRDKTVVQ
jgi:TP901 family phage tail tape measure protein